MATVPPPIRYVITITEDLSSSPTVSDEAPIDPQAFRLFGQPDSIIKAQIAAECQTDGDKLQHPINEIYTKSKTGLDAPVPLEKAMTDGFRSTLPSQPNTMAIGPAEQNDYYGRFNRPEEH